MLTMLKIKKVKYLEILGNNKIDLRLLLKHICILEFFVKFKHFVSETHYRQSF